MIARLSASHCHRRALAALSVFLLVIAAMLAPAPPAFADAFTPPKELEADVQFWIRIYTEVGTDGGLLHDERHLGVVYEEMKFPDMLSPRARADRVKAAKERYQAILRDLSRGAVPESGEAQRVRALWPQNTSTRMFAEAVQRIRFQLGQADRFKEGLIRSGAYEAHIAETLANMGLPRELAALPHVESSFNPDAYSHAGAAGLWQFMRSTGRRYMRIDSVVDERMDPFRSTVAAAQLLDFNYKLLGTWPLALTAYNHGASGMRRAREKWGTDDIVTIIRKHSSRTFGFASRNYYVAFLAALQVDRDSDKYFGALQRHTEPRMKAILLPDYVPIGALERVLGVGQDVLRSHNKSLTSAVWKGERYVPRGFELRLPEALFSNTDPLLKLADLSAAERFASQRPDLLHRVGRGETLSQIASRHGTTVATLMRLNDLRSANAIRRGQVLRLPGAEAKPAVVVAATAEKPSVVAPPKPEKPGTIYVVRRGDSLSEIARRVGMPESELMELNRLRDRNFVYEGQRLRTTKPAAAAAAAPAEPLEGEIVTVTVLADASGVVDEQAKEEAEVARAESAEPVSEAQAEAISPEVVSSVQTSLSADPSDYTVAEDGTIEVQAAETLGHYAEWLDIRASRLREINRMTFQRPVVIGQRLKVDTRQVSAEIFEQRRRDFHQRLQEEFFASNHIAGTEVHVVRPGESLWSIGQKYPDVPVWLLRQYNPDVDFGDVRPRTQLVLPKVEPTPQTEGQSR